MEDALLLKTFLCCFIRKFLSWILFIFWPILFKSKSKDCPNFLGSYERKNKLSIVVQSLNIMFL